jgi:HlyD family secretion protein
MTNVAQKSGSLKEDVAQKPGSLKDDVAQKASSSKEDVAPKPGSLKEDVAQKPGSLKEVVAKNSVAVISTIVVVGLIAAGGAYMLWKQHAPSVGTAQEQSSQQSPIERAGKDVKTLIDRLRGHDMPEGIYKTNGRIEATEVDVAAKYPGRLATETVDEGDNVTAGQVVATISSPETEAQLRNAQAQLLKAKQDVAVAVATIAQRKSDVDFTSADYDRGEKLIAEGWITQQTLELRRNKFESAQAEYDAAEKTREAAEESVKAAEADVERLQAILVDLVLLSPRTGRVQYRLARAGEVVAAGQRVLTILDLKDVYMTIYVPGDVAGKLALGDEVRWILDPVPQYVFPATISFVATEAQFTPKSVETAEERAKLMFRVKLQADPKVLDQYYQQVKTGIRGLGFVRSDPKVQWPDDLQVKLPPQ